MSRRQAMLVPAHPRGQIRSEKAGATDIINYEQTDVHEALLEMTGGRGPDACIDAVGLESHSHGPMYALDRAKQALMIEPDRPLALRQAIRECRWGNPFPIGTSSTSTEKQRLRRVSVERFAQELHSSNSSLPFTLADICRELSGNNLACWCPLDEPCHADVLLEAAGVAEEPSK